MLDRSAPRPAATLRSSDPIPAWSRLPGSLGCPPSSREVLRGHRFAEHTSEIVLEAWGASLSDLLSEACSGLRDLLIGSTERPHDAVDPLRDARATVRVVEVQSTDRSALLVDWLNELLFYADAEQWLALDVEVIQLDDRHVRARIRGIPLDTSNHPVKAATYHRVDISEISEPPETHGLSARVVLDI